jgi:deoxyribose-phosphate aldolase
MQFKDPFTPYMDHTALKINTTEADAARYCQDVIETGHRGTCFRPHHINIATQAFQNTSYRNSSVICFPTEKCPSLEAMIKENHHYTNKKYRDCISAQIHQAEEALTYGATDIDSIINLQAAAEKDYLTIQREVKHLKKSLPSNICLKVITCNPFFNDNQLIEISKAVIDGGADFLKTGTGFEPRGVLERDVYVFAHALKEKKSPIGIKVAGGVSHYTQASLLFTASQIFGPRPFIIGESNYKITPLIFE